MARIDTKSIVTKIRGQGWIEHIWARLSLSFGLSCNWAELSNPERQFSDPGYVEALLH